MAQTAYEAVFIVESQTDDAVRAIVGKYRGVIENNGGSVEDVDIWEPRRLAYPIAKKREGVYVVANFLSTPATKNELDRIFRISDDTLRYIIVKQDEKADRFPSKARAAEVERRDRENASRQSYHNTPETQTVTDLPAPAPAGDAPAGTEAPAADAAPVSASEE